MYKSIIKYNSCEFFDNKLFVKVLGKLYNKYLSTIYLRNSRKRKILVNDLPDGITIDTINRLCHCYLGESAKSIYYEQISGWKSYGAYRLHIDTENGHQWRVIYKNDIYRTDYIQALDGLPVSPGAPEYFIYKSPEKTISKYLPEVYLCKEVVPGEHYKYILEDVGEEFHRLPKNSEALLTIVKNLPEIHHGMGNWAGTVRKNHIIAYDYNYAEALDSYIWNNLEKYQRAYLLRTGDTSVSEVCRLRDVISKIRLHPEFYLKEHFQCIHGDFNRANVLIHKQDPNKIKIIDWEWAGFGLAHADLATLLQGASREFEHEALSLYAKCHNHLSFEEHHRLYQWSKMERGLFNAAYIIVLNMTSPEKIRLSPGMIKRGMLNVLHAYKILA